MGLPPRGSSDQSLDFLDLIMRTSLAWHWTTGWRLDTAGGMARRAAGSFSARIRVGVECHEYLAGVRMQGKNGSVIPRQLFSRTHTSWPRVAALLPCLRNRLDAPPHCRYLLEFSGPQRLAMERVPVGAAVEQCHGFSHAVYLANAAHPSHRLGLSPETLATKRLNSLFDGLRRGCRARQMRAKRASGSHAHRVPRRGRLPRRSSWEPQQGLRA